MKIGQITTGWNVTNSPCNWYEVTCREKHVTGLSLGNNNLKVLRTSALKTPPIEATSVGLEDPKYSCPEERWGKTDYTDIPLSSTFGPRQKASENYRYDFHRGIDMPTDLGKKLEFAVMPVFAITGGDVKTIKKTKYFLKDDKTTYYKYRVHIRHYRSGGCELGCYQSSRNLDQRSPR